MNDAIFLFDNAELALASYSALGRGDTGNQRAALTQATGAAMSITQATEFARRFPTVVTQFNDTPAEGGMGTSFSATVFKDTSGNLSLAIRGTLEFFGDIIPTDLDIAIRGAAYDQIVAMYNWWKREATESGLTVEQYRIVSLPRSHPSPPESVFLKTINPEEAAPEMAYYLVSAPAVTANGTLWNGLNADADGRVDVTGHSLGGHLALAFNKLFGGVTGQVTVFNTPGFTTTTTNQAFFSRLGGEVPTAANSGSVLNIKAYETDVGAATTGTGVDFFLIH